MSNNEYQRYTIHRSERVAKFWADKSKGTYLGYKEGETFSYAIEKSGTTKFGHDKGGYIVGYKDKGDFEIRTNWNANT